MSTRSRKRRKAERRRARQRGAVGGADGTSTCGHGEGPRPGSQEDYEGVIAHAEQVLSNLSQRRVSRDELDVWVTVLLRRTAPRPVEMVGQVLGLLTLNSLRGAVDGGWDPHDLAELVRRRDASWLPILAAALYDNSLGDGPADAQWRAAVEAIAPPAPLLFRDRSDIACGLGLTALLGGVPKVRAQPIPPQSAASPGSQHPKWRQVRALLAKAESTEFGPEAEALVAKAQELISRYALERLLDADGTPNGQPTLGPVPRKIWLDRPYVRAKASLVHSVAEANHCRAATADRHDFVILVGQQPDLDCVELLVTSLLVQAGAAMMAVGRAPGHSGRRARERSFRQSFLFAYANRIGERLKRAGDAVVAEHVSVLPVMRDHDARVADAFEAIVPTSPGRAVTSYDYAGWQAGTTAADMARLDVGGRLESGDANV